MLFSPAPPDMQHSFQSDWCESGNCRFNAFAAIPMASILDGRHGKLGLWNGRSTRISGDIMVDQQQTKQIQPC
jgi:hypothetical protein